MTAPAPTTVLDRIGRTALLALPRIASGTGAHPAEAGERESDRQHEGPDGPRHDRGGGGGWAPRRRRLGGRVHRRQHRRIAGTGLRRQGLSLDIVTSDAFAREKLDHMRALGARLQVLASDGGRMTEKLTRDMIEAARIVAERTGGFWPDQMNNTDQLAAYHAMADEIWRQTGGRVDGFVQSVGTAASLRGLGEALRRHRGTVRLVAVEPAESPVLSGGPTGAHGIDGIGAGYVVPLWHPGAADRIEPVSTAEAEAMAARLAREEGLFAGTSTGANLVAALRLAETLGSGATVVTVMCDTGMKYLSKRGAR